MSERATRTIETPIDKVKVVIHDFITGGETMDIEGVSVDSGIKSVDGRTGDVQMRAGEAYKKRLEKLVGYMVVSIGSETAKEKVWIALRNLKGPDYAFVMSEVERAAAGLPASEKKE